MLVVTYGITVPNRRFLTVEQLPRNKPTVAVLSKSEQLTANVGRPNDVLARWTIDIA